MYYKRSNTPPMRNVSNTRRPAQNVGHPALARAARRVPSASEGILGFFKSRNLLLFISLVIALIYAIAQANILTAATNAVNTSAMETAEEIGTAIGMSIGVAMLTPHVILVFVALIFNVIAWIMSASWSALTAAIIFIVAAVLGVIGGNFLFVIPSIVLCFIGRSQLNRGRSRE
jgi:hypothetical protein